MDLDQLRDYIRRFHLSDCDQGNQGYNRVLLQLFGFVGHGKSAFINSCKYALDGNYEAIVEAGLTKRKAHKLTDTISIMDNRGFGKFDNNEKCEVYGHLRKLLPLDEEMEWGRSTEDREAKLKEALRNPNVTDIIVPVLVFSVKWKINDVIESEFQTFLEKCRKMTGIFPIVVLTHKTSGNYCEYEQMFRRFGAEGVFAVENYTKEDHAATRGKHTSILNILKHAVNDVKFLMEKNINKMEEHLNRMEDFVDTWHNRHSGPQHQEQSEQGHNNFNNDNSNYRAVAIIGAVAIILLIVFL